MTSNNIDREHVEDLLDEALNESFPASDPVASSLGRPDPAPETAPPTSGYTEGDQAMCTNHSPAYTDPANPALRKTEMRLDISRTALVVIDPQVDALSPNGTA